MPHKPTSAIGALPGHSPSVLRMECTAGDPLRNIMDNAASAPSDICLTTMRQVGCLGGFSKSTKFRDRKSVV